jgi:hypothetical protein
MARSFADRKYEMGQESSMNGTEMHDEVVGEVDEN